MLEHIVVKNLRSISKVKVHPAPITVLYGPNGSGKSTLIHALAIFKNFLQAPSAPADQFFNVGSIDFGGFEEVVSGHMRREVIEIEVGCVYNAAHVVHTVRIGTTGSSARLTARDLRPFADSKPLELDAGIGITPGQRVEPARIRLATGAAVWEMDWNGVTAGSRASSGPGASEAAGELVHALNAPSDTVRHSQYVPLKRGFARPHYAHARPPSLVYDENHLAYLLFTERALEERVDGYLRQVLGYSLNASAVPGTDLHILETTDRTSHLTTGLVNEGAGLNQVAYLLTQSLLTDVSIVTIQEPEIHLHPNAIRRLAYALIDIAETADRTFILSTHSENLVVALLGAVAQDRIAPDNLGCYLVTKTDGQSTFDRQDVTATGQIEGGLRSFMEAQLEDLRHLLGIADDTE